MSSPATETVGVLAADVRPGDRVLFGGRGMDVWRSRSAGPAAVILDLHGVYLRVAPDQPLLRVRRPVRSPAGAPALA